MITSVKIKIKIKYNGTNYFGWQRIPGKPTIQEEIEKALFQFHRVKIQIYGASRTDAGAHADGQIAHFIPPQTIVPIDYAGQLNSYLPKDIRILSAEVVPHEFHARESSHSKVYEYCITTNPEDSCYYCVYWKRFRALDIMLMNEACQYILGEHDFKSFQSSGSRTKTTIRKILHASWRQEAGRYIFHIQGTAFLKYMVRNLVGSMCLVGNKKMRVSDFENIMNKKNRSSAGPTAPSGGLVLKEIIYI